MSFVAKSLKTFLEKYSRPHHQTVLSKKYEANENEKVLIIVAILCIAFKSTMDEFFGLVRVLFESPNMCTEHLESNSCSLTAWMIPSTVVNLPPRAYGPTSSSSSGMDKEQVSD
ncbi:unnamed protein product [Acanthoscelides obtectus]|uniref:Uncharacterized protein n=1 Tax=Acanthoscelides obtectus TaxID=200917 RepID=A0A9P0L7A3_ACAOB|nr:unnamed protein product [Acanthoscelides obtectus]CAK1659945.1 hypothetical protein AOBTE_LOCUS21774 [Acanthoscelides obtectus]